MQTKRGRVERAYFHVYHYIYHFHPPALKLMRNRKTICKIILKIISVFCCLNCECVNHGQISNVCFKTLMYATKTLPCVPSRPVLGMLQNRMIDNIWILSYFIKISIMDLFSCICSWLSSAPNYFTRKILRGKFLENWVSNIDNIFGSTLFDVAVFKVCINS